MVAASAASNTRAEASSEIDTPEKLVEQYHKVGEFDRMTKGLLHHFKMQSDIDNFMTRIEEIVQDRLKEDPKLQHLPTENLHQELMKDMERFPTVPRTVEKQFAQDLLLYPHVRESLEQLLNGKEINPYEDTSTSVVRSKQSASQDAQSQKQPPSESSDSESDEAPMMDMIQNDRPKRSSVPSKPLANGHVSRKDH